MLKKEVAVQLMKHLVDHDWHGYSQISRWGDGEGTCDINIGGKVYKLEQGDRDCSSAVISAFEFAGISCGGATYTGNMRFRMCDTGNFRWHPMSSGYIAKPGDVYLNERYHTAMCLTAAPDMLMEFSISETGGIDGQEGDQTGWESHTCAYYNYPWDGILECINNESADSNGSVTVPPVQNQKEESNKPEVSDNIVDFMYAVRTEDGTIWPEVKNLCDYAGLVGKKTTDIAIRVSKGRVKYRVHVLGSEWLPWVDGYDWKEPENGFAGVGKPIDLVQVYYYTPDDIVKHYGYQQAQYRVAPVRKGYYDWQYDTDTDKGQDGYAGELGVPIDRFQLF